VILGFPALRVGAGFFVYRNMKTACRIMGEKWKYNTLSRKKFPFEHEGFMVYKGKIID